MRSLSSTTSGLKRRPAWLDRISRRHWRYVLEMAGEIEAQPSSKRLQANIARLRAALGPDHDANFVYFDPPTRLRRGIRMHLKDGSPADARGLSAEEIISPWLPAALARSTLYHRILRLGCRKARDATAGAPRARGQQQPGLRFARRAAPGGWSSRKWRASLPRSTPCSDALPSRSRNRSRFCAAISHDLQTPITRMRLRADFLGDSDARGKLQGRPAGNADARQAGSCPGAREYDGVGPTEPPRMSPSKHRGSRHERPLSAYGGASLAGLAVPPAGDHPVRRSPGCTCAILWSGRPQCLRPQQRGSRMTIS